MADSVVFIIVGEEQVTIQADNNHFIFIDSNFTQIARVSAIVNVCLPQAPFCTLLQH